MSIGGRDTRYRFAQCFFPATHYPINDIKITEFSKFFFFSNCKNMNLIFCFSAERDAR